MLKLDFRAEGPSLAEVVTQINYGVGDIELAVAGVILVILG